MYVEILDLMSPFVHMMAVPGSAGEDVDMLTDAGVPGAGMFVSGDDGTDENKYFWFHHTNADTIEHVQNNDLKQCIGTVAALTYVIGETALGGRVSARLDGACACSEEWTSLAVREGMALPGMPANSCPIALYLLRRNSTCLTAIFVVVAAAARTFLLRALFFFASRYIRSCSSAQDSKKNMGLVYFLRQLSPAYGSNNARLGGGIHSSY